MQEQSEVTNARASSEGSNSIAWKLSRRIETALLRVPLSIVIGTAEIPALRLFEIAKGDLIDFEFDAFSPVTLVLAGETVAAGRLVKEGERIAVEITTMAEDYRQLKQTSLGVNKGLSPSTISLAE